MQGLQTLEVGLSLISQESIALGDITGGSKVAVEYRWAYVERGNQRQVTASGRLRTNATHPNSSTMDPYCSLHGEQIRPLVVAPPSIKADNPVQEYSDCQHAHLASS